MSLRCVSHFVRFASTWSGGLPWTSTIESPTSSKAHRSIPGSYGSARPAQRVRGGNRVRLPDVPEGECPQERPESGWGRATGGCQRWCLRQPVMIRTGERTRVGGSQACLPRICPWPPAPAGDCPGGGRPGQCRHQGRGGCLGLRRSERMRWSRGFARIRGRGTW